jgi:hypothetical protein
MLVHIPVLFLSSLGWRIVASGRQQFLEATIPGGKNVGASFLRQQFSILKKRELLPQEGRNHYHVETDRVNMTRWVALGVGPYPYG